MTTTVTFTEGMAIRSAISSYDFGDGSNTPTSIRYVVNAVSDIDAVDRLKTAGKYGVLTGSDTLYAYPNRIYRVDFLGIGASETYNSGTTPAEDGRGQLVLTGETDVTKIMRCMLTVLYPWRSNVKSVTVTS